MHALQVLYVPNAEVLTDGGFYSYNESAGAWDTPQSAQYILQNLLTSHKDALEAMKTTDGARSLAAVGHSLQIWSCLSRAAWLHATCLPSTCAYRQRTMMLLVTVLSECFSE